MPTKKSKKNVKTHNKNTKKDAIIILKKRQLIRFGLIALLILVVCVTLTFTITKSGFNLTNIQNNFVNIFNLNDQSDSVSVDLNNVVAVVNTEEITQGQLDKRYEQLPPTYKGLVTKEDLLVQLIDETILLQEAKKQEIVVTEETVDEYMQNLSIQAGVSFDQFLELLDQNGLTHDDAKEFYKKTITLNVLL